jgi:hypothetical protein
MDLGPTQLTQEELTLQSQTQSQIVDDDDDDDFGAPMDGGAQVRKLC